MQELINHPPLLQIIISNNISSSSEQYHGALNIHMDSSKGLVIYLNDAHPRRAEIKAVEGVLYTTDTNKIAKNRVHIRRFERKDQDVSSAATDDGARLRRGFFDREHAEHDQDEPHVLPACSLQ